MKRIMLILLATLWLVPGTVLAHSTLETADPAPDGTVNVSPEIVELSFNTKIEKLSNFKLLNAAGEEIELADTVVDGNTMSKALTASLPNDVYTVKWTIIGGDGHAVEGDYNFTVDAPVVAAEPSREPEATNETPAETTAPAPDAADQTNASDLASDEAAEATANHEGTGYAPAVIIGVIIVAAAFILFLRRRKA
ncbi:copper resistance CopC family protein [Paenibacillus sp. sgz302251]|uniref:copper resistance CopC family protein n=1 Tax=Paenibacillus sp. sgz302251 TaxID=3414493 RepID=UPI003C7D9CEF